MKTTYYTIFDPVAREYIHISEEELERDETMIYDRHSGKFALRREIPIAKCVVNRLLIGGPSVEVSAIQVRYNFDCDKFVIINGNHRFVEAKLRGDEYIDAWIYDKGEHDIRTLRFGAVRRKFGIPVLVDSLFFS